MQLLCLRLSCSASSVLRNVYEIFQNRHLWAVKFRNRQFGWKSIQRPLHVFLIR